MVDDTEINAISSVRDALKGLDDAAVGRVLRWACDAFDVATASDQGVGVEHGGGESRMAPSSKGGSTTKNSPSSIPLQVFVKRDWPSQHLQAAAIVYWLDVHEGKSPVTAAQVLERWRKTPGKVPGNMNQVMSNALKQGWLHLASTGNYEVTGFGRSAVDAVEGGSV